MSSTMRHRSVYVDTEPRSASSPPRSFAPIRKEEPQKSSLPLSLIVALLSICLIAWGASVAFGSERASIHSQLTSNYRGFLESWEEHLLLMQSCKMKLKVGDAREVDLTMIKMPTKRVVLANSSTSSSSADDNNKAKVKRAISSQHIEFAAAFHFSAYDPPDPLPLLVKANGRLVTDEDHVKNLIKTKAVREHPSNELKKEITAHGKDVQHLLTMDMLRSVPLTLLISSPKATATASSGVVEIDLGSHSFVRVIEAEARSRRDCVSRHWGHWNNEEETCTIVDFLHELCFRIVDEQIKREGEGEGEGEGGETSVSFKLDAEGGGRGCDPGRRKPPTIEEGEDLARSWKRARLQPSGTAEASAKATGGTMVPLFTINTDYLEAAFPRGSAKAVPDPSAHEEGGRAGRRSKKKGRKSNEGVPKTLLVVRHALDPMMLEKLMMHSVGKRLERATFVHALGLSLVFFGLCSLVMNAFLTVPFLVNIWKQKREEADDDNQEEEEEEDSKY